MVAKDIHIIGYDEAVLMMGLLGIDGTIVERNEDFLNEFKKLTKKTNIRMIIVALDLPKDTIDYIIEFKLNNLKPFVFCLPDIFARNYEREDIFFNRIIDSIGKIIAE